MRAAFLSSSDPAWEMSQIAAGNAPTHRLLGAAHVADAGCTADHFHWPRLWPSHLRRNDAAYRLMQAMWLLVRQRRVDVALCTTEASAPPVLLLRRLKLIRKPVAVVSVALMKPANLTGKRGRVFRWLVQAADLVIVYASYQVPLVSEHFGLSASRVRFVPFGVDADFFTPVPAERGPGEPDILMVGTNEGKDLPTLLAALPADAETLIVTDPASRAAVERTGVPATVSFRHHVQIVELREIYRRARLLALPLRGSAISSGQTVLLECLVQGLPVVVTDVPAVRDYVAGSGVRLVVEGDVSGWQEALADAPRPTLPETARARFTAREHSRGLVSEMQQLVDAYSDRTWSQRN